MDMELFGSTTLTFYFDVPTSTTISTLSLHDALPISHTHPTCVIPQPTCVIPQVTCVIPQPKGEHVRDLRYQDRKSTRLNSSHANISYAVFCLKKKKDSWKPTSTALPSPSSAEMVPTV